MHKKSKVSCQIKHFTKKEKHCIVMFVNIIMNFENKWNIKEKHNDEKTGICTTKDKRETTIWTEISGRYSGIRAVSG